ncbi:MAG: aspartate carbamoyltransferase catalytic subunit [Actinobacteria bacterium]|nr:aspartate carbamoyltransferase catalytic subunit [Actinomycetota bacterium]
MSLSVTNLLSIKDLTNDDINLVLDTAKYFEEISKRAIKKVPTLRGKTIVNLFLEPSTRTRISFELAAKRLSADVVNISSDSSAIKKGESLKDTAKTLTAMGIDIIVMRHSFAGSSELLAKWTDARIINAGDGAHEHPTQALLDLYTVREKLKKIENLHIGIVGDVAHSRVARSNIFAFKKMGAKISVIAPPTLVPPEFESLGVNIRYNFDEVIPEIDVIYLLRLQLERQTESFFPSIGEYARLFCLNKERLKMAKENVVIMHPGPINRDIEISGDITEMPESIITQQVASGIAVRMAVLYLLAGGGLVSGAVD